MFLPRPVHMIRGVITLTAVAQLLPLPAFAQQPPPAVPSPPPVVETIEVVATRIAEPPHEVPAAIEVITGETLRAMNARTLPQALALAAGIDVTSGGDGGPASAVPEIRGLREFDAFLLVVDDIPWGGAFNPALATLNLRDVERIEILRGPAPVTFGATSFVGVIHVVHKPGSDTRRYADATFGSFGSGGAGADVPLPALGSWRSRLTVQAERKGFADPRTSFSRGHVLWRATSGDADRRSWAMADLNVLRQSPGSPFPREGRVLSARVPLDANHNPAGAFLDDTRLALAYGFERKVSDAAHWMTTASVTQSSQNLFRGFLGGVSEGANNAHGLRETIDVTDVYFDSHLSSALRHHVRLVVGGDLLVGAGDARGATFDYSVPLAGAPIAVALPGPLPLDAEDRRVFSGGYALLEWRPAPRLTLSGGLRANIAFEKRGEEEERRAVGEAETSRTDVRPSGSVGVMVGLWERGAEHLRAYASYRSTFKPAAYDFGLGEAEHGEEEEALLEPETSSDYEAGMKLRLLQGRLDVEVDAFRMHFTNLVTATVVGGLPALENSGQTRFQGVELATDWHLPHALTGRATYSHHDGRFTDFVRAFDGVPTQLAGKRFEMSPRHLVGAGLIYSPARGVFGSVLARHVGSRFLDKRNRALAAGYTTLDMGVGLRVGRWESRVDGRNLTDRRDAVSESELGDAQYYRMDARRIELSFSVRM